MIMRCKNPTFFHVLGASVKHHRHTDTLLIRIPQYLSNHVMKREEDEDMGHREWRNAWIATSIFGSVYHFGYLSTKEILMYSSSQGALLKQVHRGSFPRQEVSTHEMQDVRISKYPE